MNKIYFKNFKGFQEQLIELTDVNFLVGENSTGKTSFLNLINILSSQEFWFNNQFNNGEIEFGYFEEILSKNTSDKFFQIGTERLEATTNDKESKIRQTRILFQFKSEKSIPKIEWVRFSIKDLNVHLIPSSRNIECNYFFKTVDTYKDWIKEFDTTKGKKLDVKTPPFKLPIPILFQIINDTIKKDSKKVIERFDFSDGILFRRYTWLAPIRAKAKRIYESYNIKFSPEGDHIPSLLKSLFSQAKNKQKIKDVLEKFGKESNLFDTLEINELGDKNISPFEIIVKYNNTPIKLPNVGYGVSQILPLIIEMLASRKTMFSIQQPEVHLHPKAQAAFGNFLFKTCQNEDNSFVIETHSDFTINRFRHCLSKNQSKKTTFSQILFFERKVEGNTITILKINSDGSYKAELPDAYRDFFIDEELKLLEL